MDKFNKLIVISEQDSVHNITLLAKSISINAQQVTKAVALSSNIIKPGVLLAYPYINTDIKNNGVSTELEYLLNKVPVFLYQAERAVVNIPQAIYAGIRGVIFRDEQLDRVMTAINTMMTGQLYYPRKVMSELIDSLIQERQAKKQQVVLIPNTNLLTKQENRIIKLVAEGARNKEIADTLNISAHTVKAHLSSIFRKTKVRNRVELLRCMQWPNILEAQPICQPKHLNNIN
ncbi:response regulator transcription factor [Rheinheimera sp. MMS21-TC3]|uniref:response regulator transcription factor n=1 Tax=Rheinheimera sp. MMS21-TC3 TaxID=3072790 RepID=UPI0028C3A705|nr:response regulator transcription factor [Rheinheimera sp. MMS21-TC3]WNO61124.1 response regulator transcription factor [Rheinheimera sp. MMS21-TC3]